MENAIIYHDKKEKKTVMSKEEMTLQELWKKIQIKAKENCIKNLIFFEKLFKIK